MPTAIFFGTIAAKTNEDVQLNIHQIFDYRLTIIIIIVFYGFSIVLFSHMGFGFTKCLGKMASVLVDSNYAFYIYHTEC